VINERTPWHTLKQTGYIYTQGMTMIMVNWQSAMISDEEQLSAMIKQGSWEM